MTPDAFIQKWRANRRPERAAYAEHFSDLCRLLGEPTPVEADPEGVDYAMDKRVFREGGRAVFADAWKRRHFVMEYKGRDADRNAAFDQLSRYALGLDSPPLLVVCDLQTIEIRTAWNDLVSERHTITLDDLRDQRQRQKLKWMFGEPEALKPNRTREQLTVEAAKEFAELAASLRRKNQNGREPYPADRVAHFVNRIVFCLFADKAGLLPHGLIRKFLENAHRQPVRFQKLAENLFAAMRDGGEVFIDTIEWFNGGLFDDAWAPALTGAEIYMIQKAGARDWSQIEPSIFGTLFERYLDPEKQKQIGAHYTDAQKIALIVEPCITRPLRAEWEAAKPRIAVLMAEAAAAMVVPEMDVKTLTPARRAALAKEAAAREAAATAKREAAAAILDAHLARLRAFRVLDPACGSGNFLYVALIALKDLERAAILDAEALGLPARPVAIGPEVVLGLEINRFAVELARVSVWIGALQWTLRNGQPVAGNPILKTLDTIELRDALLKEDGTPAAWPAADAIVGNPPFLGDKAMIRGLGEEYTARLRAAYAGRVPGGADLVCYWFEKAREAIETLRSTTAGLVSTNSIRGGANRKVLERIVQSLSIFDAWGDEPWTVEGAAVRVSLISFGRPPSDSVRLNGRPATAIYADLSAGGSDLVLAKLAPQNKGVAFNGIQKTGPFEVTGDIARRWLAAPVNANGKPNSDVLRPWWNGLDVTRRNRDFWIVDFGLVEDERTVQGYALPYGHLHRVVRPTRVGKREERTNRCWWLFQWPRPGMRRAIERRLRFIVSPEVSKHRVFSWAPHPICADKNLIVIARDDDTTFGILHSHFHEAWALRLGTSLGVGNDPRYTPTTTFETFPFPQDLTPDIPAAHYQDNPHAIAIAEAARALVQQRDAWLNPPEWVERVPEIIGGYPDRIIPRQGFEKHLKQKTLTALYNTRGTPEGAWLDALHQKLDAAVAAAYGWPADIAEEDALARLLALNLARAAAETAARATG